MSEPQAATPTWLLRREAGEPLRIMSAGQVELAQRSVDDVVARASAYLLEQGSDLAVYDRVSVTYYPERLPDDIAAVPDEPAWRLWFWLRLAPGIDLFPDYVEVVVRDDDATIREVHTVQQRKPRDKRKKTRS